MESHGVENQVSTAKGGLRFRETGEKQCQSPPYPPTQRLSPMCCFFPGPSSNFSSLCAVESRASHDEAGVCLLINLAP